MFLLMHAITTIAHIIYARMHAIPLSGYLSNVLLHESWVNSLLCILLHTPE